MERGQRKESGKPLREALRKSFCLQPNPVTHHSGTRRLTTKFTILNKIRITDQRAKDKARHVDLDNYGDSYAYRQYEEEGDDAAKWLDDNDPLPKK